LFVALLGAVSARQLRKNSAEKPDNLVTLLVDRGKGVNSQVGQGLVWTESFYWKMIFLGQY